MLQGVELSFYPSSYSAVAWSEDGDIAIAAGPNVHVLVSLQGSRMPFDRHVLSCCRFPIADGNRHPMRQMK